MHHRSLVWRTRSLFYIPLFHTVLRGGFVETAPYDASAILVIGLLVLWFDLLEPSLHIP